MISRKFMRLFVGAGEAGRAHTTGLVIDRKDLLEPLLSDDTVNNLFTVIRLSQALGDDAPSSNTR